MKKCPSQIQTAEGLGTTHGIDIPAEISSKEREIIQELARKVAEIAARPKEQEKARLWTALNDLKSERPLIFCDPENGWNEIISQDQILCESPLLRVWEMYLRKEIHWAESFKDDRVTEPYFNVPYHYSNSGYGLEERVIGGNDGGSFKYDHPIKNYEEDFHKLKFQEISVDYKTTEKVLGLAHDLFDGILEVRLKGVWWWTMGMTWDFIKLRGLENLMIDLMIYPDYVHKMMAFLRDATLHKLDFLEDNGLLGINTEGSYVGSGGFGWTNRLPQAGFNSSKVRTKDMWGFCESQETVGVSPEMVGEFIVPYQKPIMERFGLSCYGCCEPLDPRWHHLKDIKGLTRVSVSPWADINRMAEYLGKEFVYSRKPSPTPLADPDPDWGKLRAEMREFLKATRDCNVEIIMKDNHTLGNNPENASDWCRMVREEIERM
jgi:hypothetical protein